MRPLAVSASLESRLSALCIYVRSLSVSAVGHGGVVIHSTVTITELKSILLLTELKSSQNQVYTADCAAFTEVALCGHDVVHRRTQRHLPNRPSSLPCPSRQACRSTRMPGARM